MPSPCCWRNKHKSMNIIILHLKKAGTDMKSSVCKHKKKPICNKPRTWLVDNTVAAQSFSEWRIANNTCLKPKEKGDS